MAADDVTHGAPLPLLAEHAPDVISDIAARQDAILALQSIETGIRALREALMHLWHFAGDDRNGGDPPPAVP